MGRSYVQDWMGCWSFLSERAIDRWAAAVKDSRERRYGTREWLSDVVTFWDDAASAAYTAMRGSNHRPALVVFNIPRTIEGGASRTVPVFRPSVPARDPRVIFRAEPIERPRHAVAGLPIHARSVDARWVGDDGGIEIFLKGLRSGTDSFLEVAAYEAFVHVGDAPIAHVLINVIDEQAATVAHAP
jgi:hypothetical protein